MSQPDAQEAIVALIRFHPNQILWSYDIPGQNGICIKNKYKSQILITAHFMMLFYRLSVRKAAMYKQCLTKPQDIFGSIICKIVS